MGIETDIALVVGIVLGAFALPSIVSALIDGRAPRVAMIVILISGGALLYALQSKPGGYTIADVPNAFASVIGHLLH